ncbi:MAG: hypothetical protein ACLRWH_10030 [Emergencia sp.]
MSRTQSPTAKVTTNGWAIRRSPPIGIAPSAIDNALAQKPADLDELLKLLRESGCEVPSAENPTV